MAKEKRQIIVVCGVLLKNNQVLMIQRNEVECKDAHLKWEIPGGKIEFNEGAEKALKREFFEETGIIVKIKRLLPIIPTTYWNYSWGKQQTIIICYLVDFVSQDKVNKDHHVKNMKWVDVSKIEGLKTVGETIPIIKLALKKLDYK